MTEPSSPIRPRFGERELAALVALEANPEFKVLFDYLVLRAARLAVTSVGLDGTPCHWAQGRVQELVDFTDAAREARKTLGDLRDRRGPR